MKTKKIKKNSYEIIKTNCNICGYETNDYVILDDGILCADCMGEVERIQNE
jgi:hypothetical protein